VQVRSEKICSQIIDHLIAEGYRVQVRRTDVEKAIMRIRGIDPRTVQKWLKALVIFEYLIQTSVVTYRLNPLRIPELFSLLKEKSQLKLQ